MYSIYHHELLGTSYLLLVQELPGGDLNLVHQGAHLKPQAFAHQLDETDFQLIDLCHMILPREIVRHFKETLARKLSFSLSGLRDR